MGAVRVCHWASFDSFISYKLAPLGGQTKTRFRSEGDKIFQA